MSVSTFHLGVSSADKPAAQRNNSVPRFFVGLGIGLLLSVPMWIGIAAGVFLLLR